MNKTAALAFTLVGLIGVIGCGYVLFKSFRGRRWPATRGKILQKSVGDSKVPSDQPDVYHEPRVAYSYTVDGRTYTGDKVHSSHQTFDREAAQKIVDAMPDEVEVHYNPAQPSEAYLYPTSYLWPALGLGGALVMLLAGAIRLLGRP